MSLYPIEVPAGELYSTSTTRRHQLGTRAIFKTTNGPVEAVYVTWGSATSIAQGHFVHHDDVSALPWVVNTTLYGATNATPGGGALVGMLCASYPASTASVVYGWAAVRGPVTAINVAATAVSTNHNGTLYGIQAGSANAASQADTQLVTVASNNFNRTLIVGMGGGATSTIATTGGAGPAYINLFWR
jgi:hypothetical protein